jgi:ABC-type glycerol-3-phosphate transport system substrate-binding protein
MNLSVRKHSLPAFIVLLLLLIVTAASATSSTEQGIKSATSTMTQPNSFPELVGLPGEEAKADLEKKYPNLSVVVVPDGSPVTMDYRDDRVRIFINDEGKVGYPPRIG